MIIPKKLDDRVIHENDGMFPSKTANHELQKQVHESLSDLFLGNHHHFQKLQKSLKLVHLQKIVSLETRLR